MFRKPVITQFALSAAFFTIAFASSPKSFQTPGCCGCCDICACGCGSGNACSCGCCGDDCGGSACAQS